MRLNLFHRIEHNTNYDKEPCAAEKACYQIRYLKRAGYEARQDGYYRQKYRPRKCYPRHYKIQMLCGLLPRPYPRNKPAVFFHVVRDINGIKRDRRIKICKKHYQERI